MFCRECWEKVPEGTEICPACGKPTAGPPVEPPTAMPPPPPPPPPAPGYAAPPGYAVPDYLVQSILVTVLCCLPAGIVAIISAAQANSKKGVGDYYGAMKLAQRAKLWCWISLGVGLVVAVFYVMIFALGSSETSDL